MTLSCVFYGVSDEEFPKLLDTFHSVFQKGRDSFRVEGRFHTAERATRYITENSGIRLVLTYVAARTDEEGNAAPDLDAIRFGRYAARLNRENYVIYLAQDGKTLLRMASSCIRSAATMTLPMFYERGGPALEMIRQDYQALMSDADVEDENWVYLKSSGGMVSRVNTSRIYAVMAAGKLLEVRTENGTLQVHDSLENIQKLLGPRFIRCHRSCLIRYEAIQYVDFPNMSIILLDGTVAPLARSYKHTMSEHVAQSGGAKTAEAEDTAEPAEATEA